MHLLASVQPPPNLIESIARAMQHGDPSPAERVELYAPLTARELVIELVADGPLARTIATQLAMSARTVHKHLGNA